GHGGGDPASRYACPSVPALPARSHAHRSTLPGTARLRQENRSMQATRSTLAAAVAAALTLTAIATAHAAPEPRAQATDLDEVVVTATRTATAFGEVLAPVEVIDRDAIERSQARSLPDLLRGRAGISISNQGGAGKLTTL